MGRHKLNLREIIDALAPPAAPCFDARDLWLRYLESAAETQRGGDNSGPLAHDPTGGLRPRLNPDWSMCQDCAHSAAQREHMTRAGTCRPTWWRNHVPPLEPAELPNRTARSAKRRIIPIAAEAQR